MTGSDVRAAIFAELESHGCPPLEEAEPDLDLISRGVNSATLIQVLSALEDRFDIDFEMEPLFSGPMTVTRLEAEIMRITRIP
ncbi:Phosphopantetheine attachment site [Rhodococcus rhodochrous]|uniref:acyl carrier protein n=1 Tax=Rhodococcus TaxID=1827 RepID=UPI00075129BA|nr:MULTISPECIES: acyl carrier protein [Rhodococcus]MDO1486851.1 acyl carrier protein [Rhodococcus rhodochrous]OBA37870.1 hypothetical protein A5767_00340 [Rhodococcus sp. 852002-51564_SCH6189132-a]QQM53101.1 acyl carrier protein [Rhodococcus pyridinivorans]SNV28450.1 Phosphopantetheine attachment site [Rhodococcus rhodochrous]